LTVLLRDYCDGGDADVDGCGWRWYRDVDWDGRSWMFALCITPIDCCHSWELILLAHFTTTKLIKKIQRLLKAGNLIFFSEQEPGTA
jgi:hypothetical protein